MRICIAVDTETMMILPKCFSTSLNVKHPSDLVFPFVSVPLGKTSRCM